MSTTKKQQTTGAAADDTPKASSTPIHPWVKLMTELNMTLEEVAKHTYKAHSFEGLSFEPENQAKLEPPTRLKTVSDAPSKPVKGTVSVFLKEETEAQTFDYLVVAANPRELMGYGLSTPIGKPDEPTPKVLAPTLKEEAIYGKEGHMQNVYFQTTVIKASPVNPKPTKPPHVVLFSPTLNDHAIGEVMGYRSETLLAKDHEETLKDDKTVTSEYLTLYQLADLSPNPDPLAPKCEFTSKADLQRKFFDTFIKDPPSWFPYTVPQQVPTVFHTPYFNRFTDESLNKGLPWDLLDIQGQNYTTFTHGSSCFESVLQIYQYLEMLKQKGGLPTDKTASVAIVGAGPSGLLSALFLWRKGFTDITVFEKNHDPEEDKPNLYAGKTRTVVKTQGVDKQEVVCEMGTCYLSPSYGPMVDDLKDFFDGTMYAVDGNVYPLDQNPDLDPRFRALIPTGQFRKGGPVQRFAALLGEGFTNLEQPIDFGEYVILKAMDETCTGPPDHGPFGGKVSHLEAKVTYEAQRLQCKIELGMDIVKYNRIHKKLFGGSTPFPADRISETNMKKTKMTEPFHDWLELHGLLRLTGFLQYGYSVQGYGTLDRIPAWYGLVWIQPKTMCQALNDDIRAALTKFVPQLDLDEKGTVFALKRGWGQVWDNMRPVLKSRGVKFKWSAVLERIERNGVKTAK